MISYCLMDIVKAIGLVYTDHLKPMPMDLSLIFL